MRASPLLVLALAVCALHVPVLAAQTVHGTLADRATGQPIAGAMAVLQGADGGTVAGTLTDEQGRFVLRAPGPGSYRVRAERIGYRSEAGPVVTLGAGEERAYALSVGAEAIRLEGIVARGDRRCRVRPREGLATAQAWEEARKALATTAWLQRNRMLRYSVELVQRTLDAEDLGVVEESVERRSGYQVQPFVSAPVESLMAKGFVQATDGGAFYDYYAPDAEVLLSDAFLDTHCLRLVEGQGERAGQIGIAFQPLRGRRVPEIRGTFWLDARSAMLRDLEYRYVNLPWPVSSEQVGGRVEFMPVPSGALIVRRWRIRMPRLASIQHEWRGTVRRDLRIEGYHEQGGEVRAIRTTTGEVLEIGERGPEADGVRPSLAIRAREQEPRAGAAPGSGAGRRGDGAEAQLPDSVDYLLDGVVVEARSAEARKEAELAARGTRAHHLSRSQIERLLPRVSTLPQLLRAMNGSGLTVRDDLLYTSPAGGMQRGLCIQAGRNRTGGDRCRMVEVYVNGVRMSQPEFHLLGISPEIVEEIEFLSALEAGARYGTGSGNGVLLLRTRSGG